MNNDVARCQGRYVHQHGEFGTTLHSECHGCQRRTPGDPVRQVYQIVPEFFDVCPTKIRGEE